MSTRTVARTYTVGIKRFPTKGEAELHAERLRRFVRKGKLGLSVRVEPSPRLYQVHGLPWQVREIKKRW